MVVVKIEVARCVKCTHCSRCGHIEVGKCRTATGGAWFFALLLFFTVTIRPRPPNLMYRDVGSVQDCGSLLFARISMIKLPLFASRVVFRATLAAVEAGSYILYFSQDICALESASSPSIITATTHETCESRRLRDEPGRRCFLVDFKLQASTLLADCQRCLRPPTPFAQSWETHFERTSTRSLLSGLFSPI